MISLKTRPGRKLSFTNRTSRSTEPFVNGCLGLHSFVPKPRFPIDKEATCQEEGIKSIHCTKCKTEEKRSIEKLEAKVKLNASSVPIQLKKSTTAIKIKIQAEEDRVLSWTSSNKKIITVNKKTGKITAKKLGTAYVIVKMKSGATAKIDF